jgi:hypothetical protein
MVRHESPVRVRNPCVPRPELVRAQLRERVHGAGDVERLLIECMLLVPKRRRVRHEPHERTQPMQRLVRLPNGLKLRLRRLPQTPGVLLPVRVSPLQGQLHEHHLPGQEGICSRRLRLRLQAVYVLAAASAGVRELQLRLPARDLPSRQGPEPEHLWLRVLTLLHRLPPRRLQEPQ